MGGGAIRHVMKAAAVGARAPMAGQASAIRRATMTPSTVPAGVASETVAQTISVTSQTSGEGSAQKAQQWEPFDDWELAEDGIVFDTVPPPRIVFGQVPSLEEAKAATSDLKEALEKMHFKPSVTASSVRSSSSSENSETNVCVNEQSAALSPMPRHVFQAFSLLQGSTEAQDVVASLASDKNVWDAVLKNEKVMDFYKTHQTLEPVLAGVTGDINVDSHLTSYVENGYIKGASECMGTEFTEKEPETSVFSGFMKNIKLKIDEVVSNISNLFQSFMGSPDEGSGSPDGGRSRTETAIDLGIGASFIALAIAAIMVVLFKRV
ncbi:hypothetical protein QJS10_CPB11g01083 [Acorus calamus]|uniref:Uncharacterized protein n=1 Tax=Acorus calamus TaxID=4465 RepID=A0AAV9DXF0_ACOCL|nr:hypothetical protein QJS10_CPB11g01083 [Acorus calamus]